MGTRSFCTRGIDKPVLNLFRLYARLGKTLLPIAVDGNPDIGCIASRVDKDTAALLLYNHNDDWDRTGADKVRLEIKNCPAYAKILGRHYQLNAEHGNTYAEWVRQGKPWYPTPEQREKIQAAGVLEPAEDGPQRVTGDGNCIWMLYCRSMGCLC